MASVTDAANVLDLASESEATGAKWSHGWVPLNEAAKKIAARRGKQGDPRFKKYAKGSKAPADDKSGRGGGSHTVKEGDTLWAIAARELGSGSRWKEIARANGVKNPRLLQIGTKLKIPGTAKGIAPGERHPKGPSKVRKRRKKVPGKGRQTIRGTKIPRGGISQYIREKNLSDSAATPEGFELIDLTPTSSWNTEAREKAASKGQAMPGGRFPIKDKRDVQKAIRALGRAKGSHAAVKAHIIRRARALGCEHYIPDSWKSADMAGAAGFDAIDLAGRWRHGWIPLDAVAALEKAKGNHAAASRYLGSGRSLTPSQGRGSIGGMSTYSAPRQLQSSRHTESGGSLGAQDRRGTAAWMKRNSRKRYSGKSANELKQAAQHHYNRSFPGSVPQEERDKSGKELNYIINAYMSEHRAGLRDRAVAMRELGLPVGRAGTGRLKPVDEPKQPVSTLQGRPDANDQITEGDERLRRLLSGDRVAAARAKSAELRSLSDQELSLRRGSDDTTPAQRRAIDAEIDRRKGQPSGSAKHRVSPGDKIDAEAKYSQGQGVRVVRNGVFQQEGTIVGFDRHGAARVRNSKDGTVTSFYARDLEPASSPAAKLRSGKPANLPNNARPVTGDDGEILGYSSKAGTRDTHQRGGQGNVSTGMSRRQTWDVFDAEGNKIDTVINSADAANVLRVRAARAKQGPGTATQQRYVPKSLAENLPEGAAVHKSGNGFKATNARGFSRTFDSLAEATAYARGGAAPAKKQAPSGDLEARLGQMSTRSLEDLAKHGSSQQSQIARRILTRRKAK